MNFAYIAINVRNFNTNSKADFREIDEFHYQKYVTYFW
jgi:hypothetical protein